MAINTNGLPTLSGPRTFVSGGPPIALGNEVRGGIHRISGRDGDMLSDIDARYLQAGMLVFNEMTSQFWLYVNVGDAPTSPPDPNDPYRAADGRVPNETANWVEFRLSPETLSDVGNVTVTDPMVGEVLEIISVDNTDPDNPIVTWGNSTDNPAGNTLGSLSDVYIQGTPTEGMVLEYRNDIPDPDPDATPGATVSGWTNHVDSLGDMIRLEDLTNVSLGDGSSADNEQPEVGQFLQLVSVNLDDPANPVVAWRNAQVELNDIGQVQITSESNGQILRYEIPEGASTGTWVNHSLALPDLEGVAAAVATAENDDFLVYDTDNGWSLRNRAVPSTPDDQLGILADPTVPNVYVPNHFLYELRVDVDENNVRTVSWMETPGTVDLTIQQRPDIPAGATSFRTGENIYHLIGFTGNRQETVEETVTIFNNDNQFYTDAAPITWGEIAPGNTAAENLFGRQPALWFFGASPTDGTPRFPTGNQRFDGETLHITLNYEGALVIEDESGNFIASNERADTTPMLADLRATIPPGQYTCETIIGISSFVSGAFATNFWAFGATQLRNQDGVIFNVPQPPQRKVTFGKSNPTAPGGAITANTSLVQTTELANLLDTDPIFVFQHGGEVDELSIEGSDYIEVGREAATADIPYQRVQTRLRGTQGIQATNDGTNNLTNSNTSGGRAAGLPGENHFPTLRAGTGIEFRNTTPDQLEVVNTIMEIDADTSQVTVDGSVPRGANDEFIQVFVRGAADRANQYYTERAGAVQYNFRAGDDVAFSVTGLRFDVETLAGGTNPFARDELVAFSIVNALPGIPSLPVGDYSARVVAAASQSTPAGAGTVSWTNSLLDIKTESGFNVVPPSTQETQAAGSFNNGDAFVYEIAVNTSTDDNDPFISLVHSQVDQNSSIRLRSTDQVITERTGLGEISIRGNIADNIGADRQDDRLISSGQASQALNHLHDTVQQEIRDQRLEDHRGVEPVRASGTPTQITENQRDISENPYFHYRTDARTGLDHATASSFEFRVIGGNATAPTQGAILLYVESPDGTSFPDDDSSRLIAFPDWVGNRIEYITEHGAIAWRATTRYVGRGGTVPIAGIDVDVPQVSSQEEAVIVLEVDVRDLDVFTRDPSTWVQSDESALDGANHLNRFFFTGQPSAFRAARTYLGMLNRVTAEVNLSNVVYVKTDDADNPMYEWEARSISSTATGTANDLLDRTGVLAEIADFPNELSPDDRRKLEALGVDTGTDNELETITMDNGFIIGNADAQDATTQMNPGTSYTSAVDNVLTYVALPTRHFVIQNVVNTPAVSRGDQLLLTISDTANAPHTELVAGDYVVVVANPAAAGATEIELQNSFALINPDTRRAPTRTFPVNESDITFSTGGATLFELRTEDIPAMPSALTLRPTAGATSGLYRFTETGITLDGTPFQLDTGPETTLTATSNMPAFARDLVADTQYEITVVTHGATAESTIAVNLLGLSPTLTPTTVPAGDSIRTLTFSWNAPTIIELENAAGSNNLYTHENGFRLTTSGGDLPDRIQIAHQGDSDAVPFRYLGSGTNRVTDGVDRDTGIEEVVLNFTSEAQTAGYDTTVAAGSGTTAGIDAVATLTVPNQFGLITTDTGTVTPATPRDTLTLSGTDITVNGSGTTAQFSQALFTRKTDLFLGTEGANGTLSNVLVTFTWTQYTTNDVDYFFLDGINRVVAGDGSVSITANGDGVWTISSPVGATDVATYVSTLTATNSANLIG